MVSADQVSIFSFLEIRMIVPLHVEFKAQFILHYFRPFVERSCRWSLAKMLFKLEKGNLTAFR